jgi:hypothetical protein
VSLFLRSKVVKMRNRFEFDVLLGEKKHTKEKKGDGDIYN